MPAEVIMPALGMSQETGRLIAWLKHEGDAVERGDILMEVETDKTTVEVEATATGRLVNITAQPGDDVPVGAVIALIVGPREAVPAPSSTAVHISAAKVRESNAGHSDKAATPVALRVAEAHGVDVNRIPAQGKRVTRADVEAFIDSRQPTTRDGRILASPKARRLARERGLLLAQIAGSGPSGAVLANDVLNFTPVEATPSPPPLPQNAQTGTMWRRMAERLTESWQTIPHFYLKREVDVTGLIAWRKQLLSRSDIKVTYTDLLVKLVAAALAQHPHVNGQWTGEAVVFNEQIHIGLAVAVDEGLIVPVIHDADKLGVMAIATRRQQIVERAQTGKFQPADLQGGTFPISNLGMYGIDEFSAIINPPQAAILAVGQIVERVVPVDGQAVIRPLLTLNLSCDHRIVDGARGAQFLQTLSNLIADPLRLID